MTSKRLWTNGRIITLDQSDCIASQMYTQGERIVAVGDDIRPHLGSAEDVEIIDLQGKAMVPGFMDCHLHYTMTALGRVDTRLDGVRSLAELQELVREGVKTLEPGRFFRGWVWDETHYPEQRAPNRWDLDQVAPDNPVVLFRVGGNVAALNSKAWEILNLPADLPGVDKTVAEEPTGLLKGSANFLAQMLVHAQLTPDERIAAYQSLARFLAAQGVTTVHAVEGGLYESLQGGPSYPNTDVDYLVNNVLDIPLDVIIWDTQVINPVEDLARIKGLGLPRVGGDIFVDGVLGVAWVPDVARAAISEPYLDGDRSLGHLLLTDEVLADFLADALRQNLQVSCHAVGDRAIGQFIDCYTRALERHSRSDTRFRIEHGILPTDEQIERSAELGIVFSMQPAFEWQSGGAQGRYAQRLGPARVRRTHPIRQLMDGGVVVAGGSDSPANVTDPLLGVHACVYHESEENRVTPMQALRVFTINAAWSAFEERDKGTLEVNKLADMVVLDGDPLQPGVQIKDIGVVRTVQLGRDAYVREADVRGG